MSAGRFRSMHPASFCRSFLIQFRLPRLLSSAFLFFVLFILGSPFSFAEREALSDKPVSNVLLIFSVQSPSEVRTDLSNAYFDALASRAIMFESEIVELDVLHDRNPANWEEKLSAKKSAIESGHYDLIVAFGEEAAITLEDIVSDIPADTSIILANISKFNKKWLELHPNTTAVIRPSNPRPNIEFGLSLYPDRRHVILLTSHFRWNDQLDLALRKEYAGRCDFITVYIDNDTPQTRSAAFNKISSAPKDSFLVSCDWDIFLPSIGSRSLIWYQIMQCCDIPILGRRPVLLDYAVGGFMSPIKNVGEEAAVLTEYIVNGEWNAAKLLPKTVGETCTVNFDRIQNWPHNEAAIPDNAVWHNEPDAWIQVHHELLAVLTVIFAVLLAFSSGFLIYFFKYRRTTARFLAIHGHMPLLVAVYTPTGETLYSHVPFNDPDATQNLEDLRIALTGTIHIEMAETAISGKTMTINRVHANRNYTITLTKLGKKSFRREAILVVAQDTTELAELREKAFDLASRLQLTIQSIGDGVIVTDADECVTLLNHAAEKWTGFTQAEAEGKPLYEIFKITAADGTSLIASPIATAIRENRIVKPVEHIDLTSKDGVRRHIANSAAPIRGSRNALLGAILVFRDVTEEYDRREELDRKSNALQFASDLAHLGYFYYTPGTDLFESPSGSAALWPCRDGVRVSPEQWIHHDDLPEFLRRRTALFSGAADSFEFSFRSDYSGKQQCFRMEAVIDKSSLKKKNPRYFFILQDITEVRNLETEAANAAVFLRTLFDVMPCTAVLKDVGDSSRVIMANKKYCSQIRKSEDQVIGHTTAELFSPELAGWFSDFEEETIQHEGLISTKIVKVPGPAGEITAQLSHVAFRAADGRTLVFGCGMDVTDLNNAIKSAESAARAKSLFLATMCHEIRTPLNAILGFSELLQDEALPPDQAVEYLRSIHYAGNALLSLINDILDLSKLDADQMIIQPEPTDFMELIRELMTVFTAKAKSRNVILSYSVPENLPVLGIDGRRLRQVLLNLIGNAVKFTENGSVSISVSFFPLDNNARAALAIRIADTGCGISKEGLAKIFDPFVQDKAAYRGKRTENGTGLGLSIAKRLIDCMKGSLTVESTVGKGSVFTILLPNLEVMKQSSAEIHSIQPAELDLSRRILVVDDVILNVKVLCAILRKIGFTPDSAMSGEDALKLMEANRPDIVLMDLWMPGMNGVDLAKTIHANPNWSQIKLFAVTADTEHTANFDIKLFDGVIMKPVTHDALVKALSK